MTFTPNCPARLIYSCINIQVYFAFIFLQYGLFNKYLVQLFHQIYLLNNRMVLKNTLLITMLMSCALQLVFVPSPWISYFRICMFTNMCSCPSSHRAVSKDMSLFVENIKFEFKLFIGLLIANDIQRIIMLLDKIDRSHHTTFHLILPCISQCLKKTPHTSSPPAGYCVVLTLWIFWMNLTVLWRNCTVSAG